MGSRTPTQITRWLDANLHKMDLPAQWLGDEPNARRKPWDAATTRWCLVASWPYEQAAGNQSIPTVYAAINDAHPDYLCDRTYLPVSPRDLGLLHRNRIPMFGVETRHQLADFDVIGTSISYPVLSLSWCKLLTMSDIPLRWRDREPGQHPMVIVGGLSYTAPEVLAPVVDCWFLGEAEDEPGNPGIAAVTDRIARFKTDGRWVADRVGCYQALAREFRFLYFPRFVDVGYHYEDRSHLGVGPHPSKQVVSVTANLEGMRLPLVKRHVKNLDAIEPLVAPPLLYVDPAMGSGDLEVARGSVSEQTYILIEGEGLRRFSSWGEDDLHPHGADLGKLRCDVAGQIADVTHVLMNGVRPVVSVRTVGGHGLVCTPDHEISVIRGPAVGGRASHRTYVPPELRGPDAFEFRPGHRLEALAEQPRVWLRADQLRPGDDYLPVSYGQNVWAVAEQNLDADVELEGWGPNKSQWCLPGVLDEDVAWFLGMLAGDVTIRSNGDIASSSPVYLRMRTEDPGVTSKAATVLHRLFGRRVTSYARNPEKPDCLTFQICSSQVMRWLARNFGIVDKVTRRRVPPQVTASPRGVAAAYLCGFYDSDGTYDPRTGRPSWSSQSSELISTVSLMLLNLGAPCSWATKRGLPRKLSRDREDRERDGVLSRVQGLQATDGDWAWLRPSHARREIHVRRWREGLCRRNGREAFRGVIYSPVADVVPAGCARTFDISVSDLVSFTANGLLVHNCPAWCGFCALSFSAKPYRQRSVDYVVDYARQLQDNIGSVRMAPFSPDFPMHTQRKKLIAALLEKVSDEVDAPSMRVDDFIADDQFILLQVHGGMDAITLGVEGNSQRMRDLLGKGTADADVREAVTRGIRAGIRKIKLFMISNLPGENEGDVFRILKLAKDLADIREQMNQPTVRIQFSWTPLLIEANTPMQWFAPTPQSRLLGDVFEELRELKVDGKLGSKSEPNKMAFFQLCQRASRHVGEALVDAMEEIDQACWGGVPRTFKDTLENKLHHHGFANGFGDCFDERDRNDLFGWEMIDSGVSSQLLWTAYTQMREFLSNTDAHTYDHNFDTSYHGSEWIMRCDTNCYGKSCGACDHADLKIRTGYIRAAQHERDVHLSTLVSVDQRTQAQRVRARLTKPASHRFVDNTHWRFAVRRAAFRAQRDLNLDHGIAKRSIRFGSDDLKHRNWTCGVDYLEFAFTRVQPPDAVAAYLNAMNTHLDPWMRIGDWAIQPLRGPSMRTLADLHLYDLDVNDDPTTLLGRLRDWAAAPDVPMKMKVDGGYFAPATEVVNAKDHVEDIWPVRDGFRLKLRMLIRGRPTPHDIYAALTGRPSRLEAADAVAVRLDAFLATDRRQQDFLRPNCHDCALQIPVNLLDHPYHPDRCPRCHDQAAGVLVSPT
jgi:hypothetical protein